MDVEEAPIEKGTVEKVISASKKMKLGKATGQFEVDFAMKLHLVIQRLKS